MGVTGGDGQVSRDGHVLAFLRHVEVAVRTLRVPTVQNTIGCLTNTTAGFRVQTKTQQATQSGSDSTALTMRTYKVALDGLRKVWYTGRRTRLSPTM